MDTGRNRRESFHNSPGRLPDRRIPYAHRKFLDWPVFRWARPDNSHATNGFGKVERMRWAVILAGGNGSRRQSWPGMLTGHNRPKEFGRLLGGKPLLAQSRPRAGKNFTAACPL